MDVKVAGPLAIGATLVGASILLPGAAVPPDSTPEEFIPVLFSEQSKEDAIPSLLNASELDIELKSVRLVGADDVATYWVGTSPTKDLCLVAYIQAEEWVAGSSCVPITDFYQSGLGLGLEGASGSTEAYLLPEDVAPSAVGLAQGGDAARKQAEFQANLVTVSLDTAPPAATDFIRPNGVGFQFVPLRMEDDVDHR